MILGFFARLVGGVVAYFVFVTEIGHPLLLQAYAFLANAEQTAEDMLLALFKRVVLGF